MQNQLPTHAAGRNIAGPYRTTARTVGVVYLAGMVVGIPANILILSVLSAPDRLASLSQNGALLAVGAVLWLLTVAGDAAHGILMFPVLKQHNELFGADLLTIHAIPGGLWELFVGVWLIVKGFTPLSVSPQTAAASTTPTPTPLPVEL